jgi:hypothetical protein
VAPVMSELGVRLRRSDFDVFWGCFESERHIDFIEEKGAKFGLSRRRSRDQ